MSKENKRPEAKEIPLPQGERFVFNEPNPTKSEDIFAVKIKGNKITKWQPLDPADVQTIDVEKLVLVKRRK